MTDSATAPSPEFLRVFREQAGSGGALPFDRFVELALYHPEVGYYRQPRKRVGRGPGTDFYTASSSGAIFGELIAAACTTLLRGKDPAGFKFVELGAEPAGPGEPPAGVLAGVTHPFGEVELVSVDQALPVLTGSCIVFANELFDAQPFERYRFRDGRWRPLGVAERPGRLEEVELETPPTIALPETAAEGQRFDAPVAARKLLDRIAAQPWTGLLVTSDYGRTLHELFHELPQGTARAYFRHRQSNDLLDRPGEQDLTCHVCWDWLSDTLREHGFSDPVVESQEKFLVTHAARHLANLTQQAGAGFDPRRLSVLQLLHPGNLGQKFQVLHARRG